jgi:L-seryl-tRNA(Ser) seleniumtransferase
MADVYERLGVPTIVNAAGWLTRLGGSLMPPEVVAAMEQAGRAYVDMSELQAKAGEVIARVTGAEAGLVTAGASAALTLAAAACLTGLDVRRMDAMPDLPGPPDEIVMLRAQRNWYDRAFRVAGARLVEVGLGDAAVGSGVRGVEPWELEAAITERTAAVAYVVGRQEPLSLEHAVQVAHPRGVPVILDAAAQLPPAGNLGRFVAMGVDLVAFSGGKAIRGPQGTGILCGRRDLIAAAALQMLDLDALPETWAPAHSREHRIGFPHHGLGRGFKVSKEEIVGLVAALERYVELDHAAEAARWTARLEIVAKAVRDLPHVRATLRPAEEAGRFPLVEIRIDEAALGRTALQAVRALWSGVPRVAVGERQAAQGLLTIAAQALQDGQEHILASRLREVLARGPFPA